MTETCKKHAEKPVKIYGQCIGCEIESLRNENKRAQELADEALQRQREVTAQLVADLKLQRAENDELKTELDKYKMMIQQDIDTLETAIYELGRLERNLDLPDRGYVRNCFESVVRTLREGVPR